MRRHESKGGKRKEGGGETRWGLVQCNEIKCEGVKETNKLSQSNSELTLEETLGRGRRNQPLLEVRVGSVVLGPGRSVDRGHVEELRSGGFLTEAGRGCDVIFEKTFSGSSKDRSNFRHRPRNFPLFYLYSIPRPTAPRPAVRSLEFPNQITATRNFRISLLLLSLLTDEVGPSFAPPLTQLF